jgi:hypothetical protein
MASRRRQARGKQQKAEGMHGDRTHGALIEQLQHGLPAPADPTPPGSSKSATHREAAKGHEERDSLEAHLPGPDGRHRLYEDRQQHDEADKNSEKNRAAREGAPYSRKQPERPTSRGSRSK